MSPHFVTQLLELSQPQAATSGLPAPAATAQQAAAQLPLAAQPSALLPSQVVRRSRNANCHQAPQDTSPPIAPPRAQTSSQRQIAQCPAILATTTDLPALPPILALLKVLTSYFLDAPRCAHCLPQQLATSQQAALAPRHPRSALSVVTLLTSTRAQTQLIHAALQVENTLSLDAHSTQSAPCRRPPLATLPPAATPAVPTCLPHSAL